MATTDKKSERKNSDQRPIADAADVVADVLRQEAESILRVAGTLDESVERAVSILLECRGRIVVTGMGKMGCIGRKASATFSSTGAPSIFLHPAEAVHGDLGSVTRDDVVLALSNSGETGEVLELLPYMHRFSVPVISVTGNCNSTLAGRSTVSIDIHVEKEADPDSLAPTSSTTVALAMCDALAVTLMKLRGFTAEQFAVFHPGGSLGRRLLLMVKDLMQVGDSLPSVTCDMNLQDAILEISAKRLGSALVLDEHGMLAGILTDGDLRRAFQKGLTLDSCRVQDAMTVGPVCVGEDQLAAAALKMMQDKSITVLPVVAGGAGSAETTVEGGLPAGRPIPVGIIHLHDLLRSGIA